MKNLHTLWDLIEIWDLKQHFLRKLGYSFQNKMVETPEPHKTKPQLVVSHERLQREKIFNSLHSYLNGQ